MWPYQSINKYRWIYKYLCIWYTHIIPTHDRLIIPVWSHPAAQIGAKAHQKTNARIGIGKKSGESWTFMFASCVDITQIQYTSIKNQCFAVSVREQETH